MVQFLATVFAAAITAIFARTVTTASLAATTRYEFADSLIHTAGGSATNIAYTA